MMYDDYYDELSEFDMQVEDFKDCLKKAVKEEYQEKMKQLEAENARLQDIKKNWDKKVRELDQKKYEMDRAINNAMDIARRERLHSLLTAFNTPAWGVTYNYEYTQEKCDKCDKNGYIHFKSPQGNDIKEQCNCRNKICVYRPIEAEIVKFDDYRGAITPTYCYERNKNSDYDRYSNVSTVYNGEDFEEINSYYGTVFLNKEDCQRYCDYLNSKNEED